MRVKDEQDFRIMTLERDLNEHKRAAEDTHVKYCRMSDDYQEQVRRCEGIISGHEQTIRKLEQDLSKARQATNPITSRHPSFDRRVTLAPEPSRYSRDGSVKKKRKPYKVMTLGKGVK